MSDSRPIRVLHICYPLIRAGIETWLLHVLKQLDQDSFQFDIAVHSLGHPLEPEYEAAGARILKIPRADHILAHIVGLRRLIRSRGPYDIIHSHVHHTGIEFAICRGATRAALLAHAHNDERAFADAPFLQRIALKISRPWIGKYATAGLACSQRAAAAFFGKNWASDGRFQVLHCGIDLQRFRATPEARAALKKEIGLPDDAVVIGHVGRFAPAKNHTFIVALMPHILARIPNAYFVFVGDGPLRSKVQEDVNRAGLEGLVRFLGSRPDVPSLMTNLFDLLLFPSRHEGLPLTLIEAQAAGCPVVCSDEISPETFVLEELFRPISLKAAISQWVEAVHEAIRTRRPSPEECVTRLSQTDFDLGRGLERLVQLYFCLATKEIDCRRGKRV